MKTIYTAFLIIFLSTLYVFADKKMTVCDAKTGESFDVAVSDGLNIYEYNSNCLDSIPYLVERARYGESWAYKALGDCYRYGKGGVERSIFKSVMYYAMLRRDDEEMVRNLVKESPRDCMNLVFKLIDKIISNDKEGILSVIDILNEEGYYDADVIKVFIGKTSEDSLTKILEQNILSLDVGTDKMLFTLAGCELRNWFPDSFENKEEILKAASAKFPYLYEYLGMVLIREEPEDLNSVEFEEKQRKAIAFLAEADKEAYLSPEGAAILYTYYKTELEAGRKSIDIQEMERLSTLAKLPESEKVIFTEKNN